ncbi:restriction endonuclease subunit S [Apibacter sp. wkB309]|uniref:restriction endonuclease subunit S n=1 Tax=Apibacter sp. wkB309 TaxID=1679467 RepID=UPI001304BEFF|nr:restriction endonuclease subunit S [Apibacter sp. wkB309]
MSKKTKLIPELRFPEFVDEEEWEEKELNSLGELINGLTYSPNDVRGKGLLVLRSSNILNGLIALNDCVYVRTDIKGANFSEPNDILICVRNGSKSLIGKNAIIPKGIPFATHGAFMTVFRAEKPEFVFQLFQTERYERQVKADLGATINSINSKNFLKYKFIVPKNPEEQQKIASCLSSLDEMIAAQGQKLNLLKDHKKGLMQKLFPQEGEKVPKYRFKEFEKDGEWVEKKIIETTDKKIKWSFTGGPFGSNLKACDYTTEGIRIIQLQNIGNGEFNNEYKIYTSKEKADELLSCNIYSDEIILSKMGDPVGRACIIPSYLNRCVMASDGIRLVVDEKKYSKYFIYSIINSKQIREAIEKKSTGSTRKRIGLDELKGIELMIPKTIKEQQKIASCLSSLDALITAQTEKIEQLKLHKKGLMQGLFPKIND